MGQIINCPECKAKGKIPFGISTTTFETCWLCQGSGRLDTYPMPKSPDPDYVRWQKLIRDGANGQQPPEKLK